MDHDEMTPEERVIMRAGDIRINRIKCNHCEDVITSENRHDHKNCLCGQVSVDGGSWYMKRSFTTSSDYTELSIMYREPHENNTSI